MPGQGSAASADGGPTARGTQRRPPPGGGSYAPPGGGPFVHGGRRVGPWTSLRQATSGYGRGWPSPGALRDRASGWCTVGLCWHANLTDDHFGQRGAIQRRPDSGTSASSGVPALADSRRSGSRARGSRGRGFLRRPDSPGEQARGDHRRQYSRGAAPPAGRVGNADCPADHPGFRVGGSDSTGGCPAFRRLGHGHPRLVPRAERLSAAEHPGRHRQRADLLGDPLQRGSSPAQNANYQAGQNASVQAVAAKNSFVSIWNPMAPSYGQKTYSSTDF